METRLCKSCKGSKVRVSEAFTYTDSATGKQTHYERSVRQCYGCDGRGTFSAPDSNAIWEQIKGRGGKLRSKRPDDSRAYYVWRMARFHGGADVTMPVSASCGVHSDPFRAELDLIVDSVAKKVFGTDRAAAHRWGRALGHLDRDMPGLPDSAYSGGRVADEDKPIEEQHELF